MMLRGTVLQVSDGSSTMTGPIHTGQRCQMGRPALFDIGATVIGPGTPRNCMMDSKSILDAPYAGSCGSA